MTEHSVEVPRATERSAFDRFAEATTHFVSHGLFFTVSVVLVVIWFPTIAVFASVDTWRHRGGALVDQQQHVPHRFLLVARDAPEERPSLHLRP
jgi:uncharacterized membrane protein